MPSRLTTALGTAALVSMYAFWSWRSWLAWLLLKTSKFVALVKEVRVAALAAPVASLRATGPPVKPVTLFQLEIGTTPAGPVTLRTLGARPLAKLTPMASG